MDAISHAKRDWFGIIMLFLVMMLSGGNLLLSRPVMYSIVICGYALYLSMHNCLSKTSLSNLGYIFIVIFVLLSMVHTIITNHYISNLNAVLKLVSGFLVYKYYVCKGYERLVSDLSFLLRLFVVLGLFSLFFILVMPELYTTYSAYQDGVSRVFYHIGFVLYVCKTDIGFRLNGLFWEPGIFQIYLNLFLLIQCVLLKQKIWIILTLLLIFYTESTTGYIATAIILLYIGYLLVKNHKSFLYRTLIGVTFVAVFAYLVSPILISNVNDKISGDRVGSFYARQADVIASCEVAKEHPIIGIGANANDFKRERSFIADQGELSGLDTVDRASANGLLSILYMYGFPLFIIYLIGLFKQTIVPGPKWLGIVFLILSLISEPLALTPFFLLFLFSGFNRHKVLCIH